MADPLLLDVQHGGRQRALTRFTCRITDTATNEATIYRDIAGPDGLFNTSDDTRVTLVKFVVNRRVNSDLFVYSAYDSSGDMYQSDGYTTMVPSGDVKTVRINLLVDLNPGQSPNYMDITTTVQPRNVRKF
jgi:hypothetical protein